MAYVLASVVSGQFYSMCLLFLWDQQATWRVVSWGFQKSQEKGQGKQGIIKG